MRGRDLLHVAAWALLVVAFCWLADLALGLARDTVIAYAMFLSRQDDVGPFLASFGVVMLLSVAYSLAYPLVYLQLGYGLVVIFAIAARPRPGPRLRVRPLVAVALAAIPAAAVVGWRSIFFPSLLEPHSLGFDPLASALAALAAGILLVAFGVRPCTPSPHPR